MLAFNKTAKFRIGSASLLCLLIWLLVPSVFFANPSLEQVKIGVLAKRGSEKAMEKWGPTAQYLTQAMPTHNFTIVPLNFEEVHTSVIKSEIDFLVVNSSYYVLLEENHGLSRIATLRNRWHDMGYQIFGGVIFTRSDNNTIHNFFDLKGKTFMAVDPHSFGGWLMARFEFYKSGIDPDKSFRKLLFGTTHDNVVLAVRDKIVDTGTVRTDTLERMAAEGKIDLKGFKIIQPKPVSNSFPFLRSTDLYPEWPFAKLSHTSNELAEQVTIALLNMPAQSPAAVAARITDWTVPLDYRPVHHLLRELKIGRYQQLDMITLMYLARKHLGWIIAGLLLLICLTVISFYASILNKKLKTAYSIVEKSRDGLEDKVKQRTKELAESERKYRIVADNTYDWECWRNPEGEFVYCSPSCKQITGYENNAFIDNPELILNIVHPDDITMVKKHREEEKTYQKIEKIEFRIVDVSGNEHWVEHVCQPIFDHSKYLGRRASNRDITSQKMMEMELKESESRFKKLSNLSFEGILIHNKGIAIDMNESFARMFGHKKKDIIGKNLIALFIPPEYQNIIKENINKENTKPYEVMARKKDGTLFPIELESKNIKRKNENFRVTAVRDITQRRQTERALQESEKNLRRAQAVAKLGSWSFNIPQNHLMWSDETYKIFGIPKGTPLSFEAFFERIHPDDKEELNRKWTRAMKGEPFDFEHRVLAEGVTCWVHEKAMVTFDKEGNALDGIGTIQDITERKKIEGRLQQAQKLEAIGTLAGGIAHDFNNILSGIFAYSQLAEKYIENPGKAKDHIGQVIKCAKRAAEMTQQILTFSRKTEKEKHLLNISTVIKEVLKLIRSSIPSTIEIRENILSDATIPADPTQIHQIIMNLCTNAYHAMRDTGGVLMVGLSKIEISDQSCIPGLSISPGEYLQLEISDTGQGMDDETLKKIFDPYFTTKKVGEGTGLGLSLVHGIVEEYGGCVKVNSELGKGSKFTLFFPTANKNGNIENREIDTKTLMGGTERVMLVDDEETILKPIREILEDCGYKVSPFSSAIQAFNEFQKSPYQFDIVITDMTMPKMAGDQLAKEFILIRPDIPIIMCTGFSERIDKEKSEKIGIKGFLMKPVEMSELTNLMRNVLDEQIGSI